MDWGKKKVILPATPVPTEPLVFKPETLDHPEECFYRLIELPMQPGDSYRGYQCEKVVICNGGEISRALIDKPNMFEYAQSTMLDLMDPRNHVEIANANEFV